MSKSARPRKSYKPKPRAHLPMSWRQPDHNSYNLQVTPHLALDLLRKGKATLFDVGTIHLRIVWGRLALQTIFENGEQLQVLQAAEAIMEPKSEPYALQAQDYQTLSEALNIADVVQKQCTRRECLALLADAEKVFSSVTQ